MKARMLEQLMLVQGARVPEEALVGAIWEGPPAPSAIKNCAQMLRQSMHQIRDAIDVERHRELGCRLVARKALDVADWAEKSDDPILTGTKDVIGPGGGSVVAGPSGRERPQQVEPGGFLVPLAWGISQADRGRGAPPRGARASHADGRRRRPS